MEYYSNKQAPGQSNEDYMAEVMAGLNKQNEDRIAANYERQARVTSLYLDYWRDPKVQRVWAFGSIGFVLGIIIGAWYGKRWYICWAFAILGGMLFRGLAGMTVQGTTTTAATK